MAICYSESFFPCTEIGCVCLVDFRLVVVRRNRTYICTYYVSYFFIYLFELLCNVLWGCVLVSWYPTHECMYMDGIVCAENTHFSELFV